MAPFRHENRGRNARTVLVVGAFFAGLAALWLIVDAAALILAALALAALPALWDLWTDRVSGILLEDDALRWFSGKARAELPLAEIAHMRFDTRLDFSVRVTAVLTSGRRIRLPYDALPPHRVLEQAFAARGIRVERHHFSLL